LLVSPPLRPLCVERMGRIAYAPMLALQEERHLSVQQGLHDDTLYLLEHTPVITLGKNSDASHVLLDTAQLASEGIELHHTGRGGDVTYHGLGQIVGYPIVALQEHERDIKAFVYHLEETVIRTVYDFGITATRIEGLRGIWVGSTKIAAVGVRVARWTTMHGFALNVHTDIQCFKSIVPCGLHGYGVTSMALLRGGDAPSLEEVQNALVHHAGVVLNRSPYIKEHRHG
jgi:lipoate-protein ligase B